jgi:glycosyltransferase involved in cell wall biosynthesis
MDVLIVTVVHHPLEARLQRQMRALTEAGHHVRVAAPWGDYDATPPPGISAIDLPRAQGRQRLQAVRRVRGYLEEHAATAAVVLLADPELVPAGVATCPDRAVWDVRDDTAATLPDKPWVPRLARPGARAVVGRLERLAEQRLRVILADHAHASRFARPHPVIPDLTWAPEKPAPPDDRRVVHLGRHSREAGASLLLGLAASLPEDVALETIGPADDEISPLLAAAVDDGLLTWTAFTGHEAALERVDGASAGLSLLADTRETRRWPPQKIHEYMARGVPTVATATPQASELLHATGAGLVVAHDDLGAVLRAVQWLLDHDEERRELGAAAHAAARAAYDWAPHAERFVTLLEDIPAGGRRWPR